MNLMLGVCSDVVGKTAMWKIRVYGPAKFAERTGRIARVLNNVAYTDSGHALRMNDMVLSGNVGGGGMWALQTPKPICAHSLE